MVIKCNRIASLVILNYKIFLGEVPQTPLTRGGSTPLSFSSPPPSCRRRSVITNGVQWPYHFFKADDGPVFADIFCKQFGPRSGLASGSKLFDTLMIFLIFATKNMILKNINRQQNGCKITQHAKSLIHLLKGKPRIKCGRFNTCTLNSRVVTCLVVVA